MWWSEPVPVRLKANQTFNVGDPEKAAEILLYDWPGDQGAARHRAARRAVLKALENAADAKASMAARKAFAAAVAEAGAEGAPVARKRR